MSILSLAFPPFPIQDSKNANSFPLSHNHTKFLRAWIWRCSWAMMLNQTTTVCQLVTKAISLSVRWGGGNVRCTSSPDSVSTIQGVRSCTSPTVWTNHRLLTPFTFCEHFGVFFRVRDLRKALNRPVLYLFILYKIGLSQPDISFFSIS